MLLKTSTTYAIFAADALMQLKENEDCAVSRWFSFSLQVCTYLESDVVYAKFPLWRTFTSTCYHTSSLCRLSWLLCRCCRFPLRFLPMVFIAVNGFLGDLRQQLVRKLAKAADVPPYRVLVTVSNWTTNSFLTYVECLEARCDRKCVPDLEDCEVLGEVNAHKRKQHAVGKNVTASWCFSTMSVAEELCDLFQTLDVKALRMGPQDKNSSVAYKNILFLPNGNVVNTVPHVHISHRKVVSGTLGSWWRDSISYFRRFSSRMR
jgi:hypothetical protein